VRDNQASKKKISHKRTGKKEGSARERRVPTHRRTEGGNKSGGPGNKTTFAWRRREGVRVEKEEGYGLPP